MKIHTEIVNGICPECEELTMLVGVTRTFYRCMTCGSDLEQRVNGKIAYVPVIPNIEKLKEYLDGEKI
tara:strand:+ start:120 stop:323 length:204 start_codon:yes stop_codon:yes gene_type:complete